MKLVEAQEKDWKILLEWRNDNLTRKYSITSKNISEKEHKNWLREIINNKKRKLYIVVHKNIPIGTVRADYYDNETIISWTVSPSQRQKGYGKKMVKLLVKNLSGKITAIIKKENLASIAIAESAGLTFKYEKDNLLFYSINK